jgi:hypothetical protein
MLYPCQRVIYANKGSSTFTAAYLKLYLKMFLCLLQLHIQYSTVQYSVWNSQ